MESVSRLQFHDFGELAGAVIRETFEPSRLSFGDGMPRAGVGDVIIPL
jgi:hypothetical protein